MKKNFTVLLVLLLLTFTLTGCGDSSEGMEVEEYANKVNGLISEFLTAKLEFEDFFDNFDRSSVLSLNQLRGNNWKEEIEETMDEVVEVINQIKNLEAPEVITELHHELVDILENLQNAKYDIINSYVEKDMKNFARSLQNYQNLLDDLLEVTKGIQELLPESERINFDSYL